MAEIVESNTDAIEMAKYNADLAAMQVPEHTPEHTPGVAVARGRFVMIDGCEHAELFSENVRLFADARRIAAALNATRHLTTGDMEAVAGESDQDMNLRMLAHYANFRRGTLDVLANSEAPSPLVTAGDADDDDRHL